MKLGFISSILDWANYKEVIDTAHALGFTCIELASWPCGKAERRYAGVSHLDAERVLLDDEYAASVMEYVKAKGIELSSLAYYPNPMDADPAKRKAAADHLLLLIQASHKLGIGMVTTFLGRDPSQTVEENLKMVPKIWNPILQAAEEHQVRIAIENCPMLFDQCQWPGGQNLMTTPAIFRKVFELLPSGYLGLNYDPSHFVWQNMDYIRPIYEFRDKIFHVHYKDIKVYPDKRNDAGIMAYPLTYMSPKLPGLGDVDWGAYVSALTDIRYQGCTCIEIEDKAFEGSRESVLQSLKLSKRYMEQFVI